MSKPVRAEIIAVGTELLLGQIANTNAQWISQQLAMYGVNVHYHEVVGDNLTRLAHTFQKSLTRSNLIIVTGGLGPTEDDLTREAFQEISHYELIEHKESMKKISTYFTSHHVEMTENNRKQARIFKKATVLPNKYGMAPGMALQYDGAEWIFLPGVPREMKQIFSDEVVPYIINKLGDNMIIKSLNLRFIGIGEAKLEHELADLIRNQTNPTIAPLAQDDGMIIRLTAKEGSAQAANELLYKTKEQVLARVGAFFYGVDDETLEKKAAYLLQQQKQKLAVAESLTGGKFVEKLISIPGSSDVCMGGIVCYDTKIKEAVVGVSPKTMEQKGTVSEECAEEMAINICNLFQATIGMSFTGVAGPQSIENQPVGTTYIGLVDHHGYKTVQKHVFTGDREAIRRKSVLKGYEMLIYYLKSRQK